MRKLLGKAVKFVVVVGVPCFIIAGFAWLIQDADHDSAVKLCKEQVITVLKVTQDGKAALSAYSVCMKGKGYATGQ